jgi:methyl-accepting chemotaxis protein
MENGVTKVSTTAEILNQIMEKVNKVNSLVLEIATGSDNQKAGIMEITKALEQVNKVVQQNSSISDRTAIASGELQTHSLNLQQTMQRFILHAS